MKNVKGQRVWDGGCSSKGSSVQPGERAQRQTSESMRGGVRLNQLSEVGGGPVVEGFEMVLFDREPVEALEDEGVMPSG